MVFFASRFWSHLKTGRDECDRRLGAPAASFQPSLPHQATGPPKRDTYQPLPLCQRLERQTQGATHASHFCRNPRLKPGLVWDLNDTITGAPGHATPHASDCRRCSLDGPARCGQAWKWKMLKNVGELNVNAPYKGQASCSSN
jgi:hypothetical protein